MTTLPTATSPISVLPTPVPCTHHWLIGGIIPNQPRDKGTCKLCGATKLFQLIFPEITYRELQNVVQTNPDREIAAYLSQRLGREI